MKRNGRRLKMIPPAHLAAWAAGGVARAAGKAAAKALRKHGLKAAAGITGAAGAATAARTFAATQRRATARAGVQNVTRAQLAGIVPQRLFAGGRRRTVTARPANAEESRPVKVMYGRKRAMNVKTLSKVTTQRRIWRFQNIAQMDRVAANADRGAYFINTVALRPEADGSMPLPNPVHVSAGQYVDHPVKTGEVPGGLGNLTAQDTWLACPLHLYLLNGIRSRGNLGTSVAGRLMIKNDFNGNIAFQAMYGVQPNFAGGTEPTMYWNQEYASSDTDISAFHSDKVRYVQKNWYDIKLYVRNATNQRTHFDIAVVSFAEDHFDPLEVPSNDEEVAERHAFWYGLARKNVTHPLRTDKNYSRFKNKLVVHKRVRVIMEKNQTSDTDTSPTGRVVKIFYRDGATYDYATSTNADVVGNREADGVLNPNVYEAVGVQDYEYKLIPKPKARKYLMITAFDPTVQAVASANNTVDNVVATSLPTNPSYDIVLRMKETRFPDTGMTA